MLLWKGINMEIDGYLKNNLDSCKAAIKKDWDMIFVIDGKEGSGKSVMAMQCAYYCDPSPDLIDRITFTPDSFKKAVLNAKPFQAVIYDEAHSGLNARASMSLINRNLISMLTEIRQRNLFVFIVLPTFFDLDKYVALWRSRALIHVYTNGSQRGLFAAYNTKKKMMLYLKGKPFYKYNVQTPNFHGKFSNFYPVDEAEYRKRKAMALKGREQVQTSQDLEKAHKKWLWTRIMAVGQDVPVKAKIALLDITEVTYYRWLKQKKESDME